MPRPALRPLLAWIGGLAIAFGTLPPAYSDNAAQPRLDLQPCRLRGVEHQAWCGRLERPLDPAAPEGKRITIELAVLPALARRKKPDAVFFFAGGPGQSAIELAGHVGRLLGRLGQWRDIVLIDQRGTGRSAPLSCDDARRPADALGEAVDVQSWADRLERCRARLQQLPHGDLRHYTTRLAVQDAEAVRRSLGLTNVNLFGGSYGTRVALEYLRQFPGVVRRAVLDGVAPPDMALPWSSSADAQAALDALLAWCDADARCRTDHPRLRDELHELRRSLPRAVTLIDPATGRERKLQFGADALALLVRAALYSPLLASALPLAISEARAGRFEPLAGLASAAGGSGRATTIAQGQHFSVICAEDMGRAPAEQGVPAGGALFDASLRELYRRVCESWPKADVPEAFFRMGPTRAPVLLLSGAVDPVTPPRHGERVARALGPRARHIVVPEAGHGVSALPCLRSVMHRFIDEADDERALAVDASCAGKLPRPPAVRPPASGPAT